MVQFEQRHTARARQMRNEPTSAEHALWRQLSGRKLAGVRFNRQVCIGPFICDFAARSAKLIIEIDGGQHDLEQAEDEGRTAFLESRGYRVIRFWNNEVLGNIEGVVMEIQHVLADIPSPNPSRKREGDEEMRYSPTPTPPLEGRGF